jgi:hypothetical protein
LHTPERDARRLAREYFRGASLPNPLISKGESCAREFCTPLSVLLGGSDSVRTPGRARGLSLRLSELRNLVKLAYGRLLVDQAKHDPEDHQDRHCPSRAATRSCSERPRRLDTLFGGGQSGLKVQLVEKCSGRIGLCEHLRGCLNNLHQLKLGILSRSTCLRRRCRLQSMQQLGWVEGRNLHVDIRWAAGNTDDTRKRRRIDRTRPRHHSSVWE